MTIVWWAVSQSHSELKTMVFPFQAQSSPEIDTIFAVKMSPDILIQSKTRKLVLLFLGYVGSTDNCISPVRQAVLKSFSWTGHHRRIFKVSSIRGWFLESSCICVSWVWHRLAESCCCWISCFYWWEVVWDDLSYWFQWDCWKPCLWWSIWLSFSYLQVIPIQAHSSIWWRCFSAWSHPCRILKRQ